MPEVLYRHSAVSYTHLVKAAWAVEAGGVAEAVLKMAMGNGIGFAFSEARTMDELFGYRYGAMVLEVADDVTCLLYTPRCV